MCTVNEPKNIMSNYCKLANKIYVQCGALLTVAIRRFNVLVQSVLQVGADCVPLESVVRDLGI